MLNYRQFTTVAIGTTSLLISWFSIATPLDRFLQARSPFSFTTTALANTPPKPRTAFRYVPPKRGNPKSTQATGSRGCPQTQQSQPLALTLLVPNDHDGLTTSSHPSFFWHVSAPVPMTFVLTERGVVQPLWEQQIRAQMAGIIQLKMPQNLPELAPGKEYRWSVTLICNPERPSANPFIQTWIQRVPATTTLTQQLAVAKSDRDRTAIYAEAGLWYDALAAISNAYADNPEDPTIVEERLSLLDSVGLDRIAAQERQSTTRQ